MGIPWTQTVGAAAPAGAQAPYSCDYMQSPFLVTWSVEGIGGGTSATYNVEYTLDDVNEVAVPVWFAAVSAATANTTGALATGCRFLRINATTGPVGGAIVFRALQGMTAP